MQLEGPKAEHAAAAIGRVITAAVGAVYAAAAAVWGGRAQPEIPPSMNASSPVAAANVQPRSKPASALDGAVWVRSLSYGQCEEYRVDLARFQLFFLPPGSSEDSVLSPPEPVSADPVDAVLHDASADSLAAFHRLSMRDLSQSSHTDWRMHARSFAMARQRDIADSLVAVLAQEEASSPAAVVRSAAFVEQEPGTGQPTAELAALDGFAQAPGESEGPIEAELARMEKAQGLKPLSPLDSGAVVRLEDWIDAGSISSEVLGSRTMGLGASYSVEPGSFHLMLEDLRGSRMLDKRDVTFDAGRSYVAVRLGRGGDSHYPERLIYYCVEGDSTS